MATPSSLQEQIKAQGAVVRQLKKDEAAQEKVWRSCNYTKVLNGLSWSEALVLGFIIRCTTDLRADGCFVAQEKLESRVSCQGHFFCVPCH